MLYLLYKIGLFILRCSTHDALYRIVTVSAKIKYFLSKKDRELVKANLRNVIPGASQREIYTLAQEVFINFGKYLVDFFSLTKGEKNYLGKAIQFEGLENLNEALKSGRGCIIVSGHFGNWELAGCALANLGYKVNIVALAHTDPRINNLFIDQRRKAGINVISIGTAKISCQRALSRGEIIAILGDRPFGDRGIEVNFFGKPAMAPRGAALFSLKKGSPIVMTFTFRERIEKNAYKVIFEKPYLVEREGSLDNQLKDLTQRFITRFEYYIKKYPSQWYMFNKVWKDQ